MGNYKSRRPGMLQGWQITAADMMFRGATDEEIVMTIWPTTEKKQLNAKKTRLRNLRKDEIFQNYYKSLITEWTVHNVGKALKKLSEQIDHEQPWLANKAANDILQRVPKSMLGEEDENTVVVKVEGMPEIGSPEE